MRFSRWVLGAALAAAALALLLHVRAYAFLCDDAFISFRYARNLAAGHGLVFNPGFERVEGYSNFLWVVVLAGFDRVGIAPERAATFLSWFATLALWAWVVRFAWLRGAAPGRPWTVLVPAVLLATNRSFAVWASSGLETRLFEFLVVASAMRLVHEVDSEPAVRRLAPWGFGLAALTRPDGMLFAAVACAVEAYHRSRARPLDVARLARAWLAPVALVAGHLVFRRLYYGSWLPNTYYAKVDGRTWWTAGFDYLGAFALEYAIWLWVPLAVVGAVAFVRARRPFFPAIAAALVIPHAIYVTAIGGDHFEYRPFTLYLPFAFVLVGAGVQELVNRRASAGSAMAAALLALLAWAGFELPWRSHVDFPPRYMAGFPGRAPVDSETATWLDPGHGILYRLPGFRTLADWHLERLRASTARFVGVRQEEHAQFLTRVEAEGRRLGALVRGGVLPRDAHLAISCVGAIPYYSDLRTLDRLGLTDATVARGPRSASRVMAHDRSATLDYARERGVDLWAADDVHLLHRPGSTIPLTLISRHVPFHAAEVGGGDYLLVLLPQGPDHARQRFPNLTFVPGNSDAFLDSYLEASVLALRDSLERREDDALRRGLALFLVLAGRPDQALREYEAILERAPDDADIILAASWCLESLGRPNEARAALPRALELARARRDTALVARIQSRLDELAATTRPTNP